MNNDKDPRWAAIIARDAKADALFVYGVKTTGVYCRPSSGSRLPRPDNIEFFDSAELAEAAGYRPSKRAAGDQTQLAAQRANLQAVERRVSAINAQVKQALAQAESAQAQRDAAQVNADAAVITASTDGRVGDRTVRVGQFVQQGTRLMSVVPMDKLYISANFKETQIGPMRAGQSVDIRIDALPGTRLKGHVESIAPGTGAQFSLIPPQNATGNFTKIVQRVPVRIALDVDAATRQVLVPGLSVVVEVNTREAAGNRPETVSAKGAQ